MSNLIPVQQAWHDAQQAIKKFPKHKDAIEDSFDLMRAEIDDGSNNELEIDKFYRDLDGVIHGPF